MENKIEIKKNAPDLPDGRVKYPFKNMEIGDSFVVENVGAKGSSLRMASSSFCKRRNLDWKFKVTVSDDKVMIRRIS